MKIPSILSGVLAIAASIAPTAAAPAHDKRQSGTIVTTGVTGNGIQPRLELRTMQREFPDQFNVYILGLRRMMAVPQNNVLSYYQVSGIHGRPYTSFDGVTPAGGPATGHGGGYCVHVSNIFATWHRPYLALFEQILHRHVNDVAREFPAGARGDSYRAAAQNFRIPYWDWASTPCSECLPYPRLISLMYLDVETPNGRQTLMNPLFRYNFTAGPPTEMAYQPFGTWTWTRRFPSSWDTSNAWSQNDRIAPAIANAVPNLRDRIYNLFTANYNFNQFSNSGWFNGASARNPDSIEAVHDLIHSIVGSTGHMAYVDFAAFDPIFMLHHAMADRIWALWSAVREPSLAPADRTVVPAVARSSTFMWPAGTTIDQNTGLAPFHRDSSRRLWTSADVMSTTTFGYVYPEARQGANSADVMAQITRLYGRASTNRKRDLSQLSKRADDHHYNYIANIASQKFKMNKTYRVYVFLGEPPADPQEWPLTDKLVGTHAVMSSIGGMENSDVLVSGSVPLTSSLLKKCDSGELADLEPTTVEPYLAENMQWRVAAGNGEAIDAGDVPDLSVSVVSSDVRPPTSDSDMPVWGHVAGLPKVTDNKKGGHNSKIWDFTEMWSIGELIGAGMKKLPGSGS